MRPYKAKRPRRAALRGGLGGGGSHEVSAVLLPLLSLDRGSVKGRLLGAPSLHDQACYGLTIAL